MYTHCPNCDTHFEITQEYIDIANGQVRCGKCDHIFNALDNLYESELEEEEQEEQEVEIETFPESEPEAPEAPAEKSMDQFSQLEEQLNQKLSQSQNKFADNDTPIPAETIQEPEETEQVEDEPSKRLEEELDLIDFNDEVEVEEEQDEDNYSTSLTDFSTRKIEQEDLDILNSLMDGSEEKTDDNELLDELDDLNKTLSDSDTSLDEPDDLNKALSDDNTSLDEEFDNSDNDFDDLDTGDDLLAELEQLQRKNDHNNSASESISISQSHSENNSLDDSFDDLPEIDATDDYDVLAEIEEPIADSELSIENTAEENTASQPPAKSIEEVVPSFLTQADSTTTSPSAMLGWLGGTIVLILVLAVQYLHTNSTLLAQSSTFRPFLESLCPITSCSLPLKKSPRQIITVDHDVRSHSKINNALEIQLTFKNKADFTQGYPQLEIIFSNPLGKMVAQRTFSPDEYLTGEVQHTLGLKSNQTQDVHLKIVDPDPASLLSFQFNYY